MRQPSKLVRWVRFPSPAPLSTAEVANIIQVIDQLLTELKTGLRQLYGARLQGVYLYGSYARVSQQAGSDVDVMLVLDRVDHYCAEIDQTGNLTSQLSLKYGVSISRVIVSAHEWRTAQTPFLNNARREGVAA